MLFAFAHIWQASSEIQATVSDEQPTSYTQPQQNPYMLRL